MTVDASGNVYTTGFFSGTVDFDPGAGTFDLTSVGNNDVFIQKLDAVGDFIWAKAFGSVHLDNGYSIAVDTSGNVYATGYFQGTIDFDPGAGTFNLASAGNYDLFIQKLDASGNFVWAKAFGSTFDDRGYSMTLDASGNVYTTGYFSGTVDFDPGAATFNLSGSFDVFMHKISQCSANTGIDLQTACNSYQWIDGQTYTASNNSATVTLTNAAGCDSTVTLNLTIANSNTGSETVTECDSYTWNTNGQSYSQSGLYTEIITNTQGCDSTVTLDLTITNSSTGSEIVTECDSFIWIDGNTYTANNNTATHTLTNAAGCDSVVTLDLTINSSPVIDLGPDTTICSGTNYILDAGNGFASYLWSDGSTNSTLTVSNTGTYWVEVTDSSGCTSNIDTVIIYQGILNVDAGPTQTVCLGCGDIPDDSIALSASGAQSYAWDNGVSDGVYFTPSTTALYTVTGTDAYGCSGTDTVTVFVGARSCMAISISGLDSASYANQTYYQSGLDTIYHTNASGCDSIEYIDITINHTGINENILKDVEVYPNPTSDIITLKGINSLTDVSYIHLLDNKGALQRKIGINETQVDLSTFYTGIYFIEIKLLNIILLFLANIFFGASSSAIASDS